MSGIQTAKFDRDLEDVLQCLKEVLEDLGHEELLPFIPFARPSSTGTQDEVQAVPAQALKLVQMLSLSFQLLNMVEENVNVQQRRAAQASGQLEQEAGLWPWTIHDLKDRGFSEQAILETVRRLEVEPVLTAHPTEAKRSTILEHHRDFYLLLVKRENQMWTPVEQAWQKDEMKTILERLWRTGEIFLERPDVASELRNVMHYLKNVFPKLLPWLDNRFERAWREAGFGTPLEFMAGDYPKFQLGTWVGGDRDGHPFVTGDITAKALEELRLNALIVLRHNLIDLAKKLSISDQHQGVPEVLAQRLAHYRERASDLCQRAIARNPGESWRNLVSIMIERLPISVVREHATQLAETPFSYQRPREMKEDLGILARSLREIGAQRLANTELHDTVRLLETYGFHSARLDLRQNSRFHEAALQQLLEIAGIPGAATFSQWSHSEKAAFFAQELVTTRPFTARTQPYSGQAKDVMECLKVFLEHRARYGSDGLGSYIVSMTHSVEDLYTVYLLAREAGLSEVVDGHLVCPVPVVPLFETIDDLEASVGIMEAFLSHPVTKSSLSYHQREKGWARPQQQIMVGYSDSCKDGGILASQWHLYQAQSRLSEVAARHGVDVCFFHGRGGTVSRGAGPIHRFMQSLPPGGLSGAFRMTEQGETIARKYANRATAVYNLEVLLASVTSETLQSPLKPKMEPTFERLMGRLASRSRDLYRSLITRPDFMAFFRQATPIDVLEHSRIGSRPSKRTGQSTLEDLRAIPWVFSWNQSRFYLPSWYGVGTALRDLERDDPRSFSDLCQRIGHYTLLNYVLHNVETTVASASEEIMAAYANLVTDADLRRSYMDLILGEFHETRRMLIKIFGSPIEERRPYVVKTISLREHGLRVLHQLQIYQLQEWRRSDPKDTARREILLEKLFVTINAIAGGLRNTG